MIDPPGTRLAAIQAAVLCDWEFRMAKPPYEIAALDHLVVRAKNIDSMLAFYQDVLGCPLAKHNEPLGLYHLRAGLSMIDLVDMNGKLGQAGGAPPGADGRNVDHVAIRIQPFDEAAIRAHLAAHGVEGDEVKTRFGASGDGPSLYLSDPEGNGLELKAA